MTEPAGTTAHVEGEADVGYLQGEALNQRHITYEVIGKRHVRSAAKEVQGEAKGIDPTSWGSARCAAVLVHVRP